MVRKVFVLNGAIEYQLEIKQVKNINLRIKPDGKICVSANRKIPIEAIDKFVSSKADLILKALDKFKNSSLPKRWYKDDEIKNVILELCQKYYPYFEGKGIKYPTIRFRKMVSRWGSCHPTKEVLTFNTNLVYVPLECIEYVVLHEFTHFLQANHSSKFYNELEKTCPDWKNRRKKLKNILIR